MVEIARFIIGVILAAGWLIFLANIWLYLVATDWVQKKRDPYERGPRPKEEDDDD